MKSAFLNNELKNNLNSNNENYIKASENIEKISKMNWNEIKTYFNIESYDEHHNTIKYKKKYSNIVDKTLQYETDYELKINDDEVLKFIKIKK